MSESLKSSKVLLGGQATKDIFEMIAEIKTGEKFVQTTPSKLTSWIVSRYRSNAFGQDRQAIRKAHFNHQKALQEALKGAASEEEFRAACAQAIKQIGRKTQKHKTDQIG